MKILVFGAGFLGHRIARTIPGAHISHLNIMDRERVRYALHEVDVAINAAGKTGQPNVDYCETHQEETYRSNVLGALELASACAKMKVHLIHLGSGCVFYGKSPRPDGMWYENDFANPISYYSKTKYATDIALASLPRIAVLRLRMPIDSVPHPRNLITKLATYKKIIQVVNSITIVDDLLHVIQKLAEKRAQGIFHVVNPGPISHEEILTLYREIVDPKHRCEFIAEENLVKLDLATKPRSNCVLASTRLQALDIEMRPIRVALTDTLKKYVLNLRSNRS